MLWTSSCNFHFEFIKSGPSPLFVVGFLHWVCEVNHCILCAYDCMNICIEFFVR
jgi:hypothetical protein